METADKYLYTQNRELSWLRFNQRVLEEARDSSVPLMERLKFVEIFTSNLDEFFMVRVGSLTDMAALKETPIDNKSGMTPDQQLSAIFAACVPLYKQRDKVFHELDGELRTCSICRMIPSELEGKAKRQADGWFKNEILPVLSPQVIDLHHPFPHLPNKSLNIVLLLRVDGAEAFGIIPVPDHLPAFYRLDAPGVRYVLLEDLLLEHADQVFRSVTVLDKAVISVTRNADISPEDDGMFDLDEDYPHRMKTLLKKRTRLAPVRLEIQKNKSERLISFLCSRLKLAREQVFISKNTPLKLSYVYGVTDLLSKESAAVLCERPYIPRLYSVPNPEAPLIPQLLKRDLLLFYPYESMEPFLRLVKEAAYDPKVMTIKITIYRLASQSRLAEYLCAAAENGKTVTVLMELRARFDEQNNLNWAERLEYAGCTVVYGSEGIKVHSKICQITRKDKGSVQVITQIGTGNYNEKTTRLYTDLSYITSNPAVCADGIELFQSLSMGTFEQDYSALLVSPYHLRDRVLEYIRREQEKGPEGYIFLKMNSLTDRKLIDALAQASQAGVVIDMNIRGICCLRPGVAGYTEHITVFSIVGRYLEHSRIYCFGKGDSADLYIASADFMTRNTEHRVEAACPILDPEARAKLFRIIETLKADTAKVRFLAQDGRYHPAESSRAVVNSQQYFMDNPFTAPSAPEAPSPSGGLLHRIFARLSGHTAE